MPTQRDVRSARINVEEIAGRLAIGRMAVYMMLEREIIPADRICKLSHARILIQYWPISPTTSSIRCFKPVVTVKGNKNAYVFDAVFKNNNPDLLQLVAQKKARYAVHVECTQTRYRDIFRSDAEKFSFEVPAGMLDGRVEVTSFVLASKALDKYRNESFHPDYAKLTFRVGKGETLAVGLDREFTAEKKSDPLRKVPSIFSIVPSDEPDATGMDIDTSGAKVRLTLSRPNYDAYIALRSDQSLHAMLSAAVIVPALVTVIDEIRSAGAENSIKGCKDRRWFLVVARRLREIGIDPENPDTFLETSLRIAHEMLGQPLSASLEGLKMILQDTE